MVLGDPCERVISSQRCHDPEVENLCLRTQSRALKTQLVVPTEVGCCRLLPDTGQPYPVQGSVGNPLATATELLLWPAGGGTPPGCKATFSAPLSWWLTTLCSSLCLLNPSHFLTSGFHTNVAFCYFSPLVSSVFYRQVFGKSAFLSVSASSFHPPGARVGF